MINAFLCCRNIFCVMYYEIVICQMLQSIVKFRQNMPICHKLICKTKFHMQTIHLKGKCLHYDGLKGAL